MVLLVLFLNLNINMMFETLREVKCYLIFLVVLILQQEI